MTRLLLTHLQSTGIKKVRLVNRSAPKMMALQEEFPDVQIEAHLVDALWETVRSADIVFTSTSAVEPFVTAEVLAEENLSERKRMFV
ncbi:MAG: glutamyl-tRNA reductase, partial [Bacteroidota bacterium]